MTDAIEQGGTAMTTQKSAPGVRYLYDQGLIRPGTTAIDYGAGYGRNADWLRARDVEVYAYDPFLGMPGEDGWTSVSPDFPDLHADVLLTSFVLNVLTPGDELELLEKIRGLSYFTYHIVRNRDLLYYTADDTPQYIANCHAIAKAGFPTSRGYQRRTKVDHPGIICIREVHGYRIFEGQLHRP